MMPSGLRPATPEEVTAITATPDTKRVVRVLNLGFEVSQRLYAGCRDHGNRVIKEDASDERLAPGIHGQYLKIRHDATGQINLTTADTCSLKVGDHIDSYDDPNVWQIVGNTGKGDRWHRFVPEFNRDVVKLMVNPGELWHPVGQTARERFMKSHDTSSFKVYWMKFRPYEAVLSPASWVMHEGSSEGLPASDMFLCSVGSISLENFSSPLIN